ncbi:MAG: aminoglycoside phosphotransferase family protein [Bradyrhizobium sp.]|uniref:phosphotransferase family protein n=1 Tax=Bradyrhizobium sp. TaxID=376 RepID=UPI001E1133B4|nr:aminoglycoside phosphotransferase family protein [Bradyrhizobium sp.]MBV9565684.1 aminoglycoside phosphotransferase family protein [Bradyrhizobium sp.]
MKPVEAIGEQSAIALANRLAKRAGRGHARALSPLSGGRNNQVYRVDMLAGAPLVLKRYFSDPRDGRDRLGAEWSFLRHTWSRGIRAVPEPLACDPAAHAALYELAPGRKFRPAMLEPVHIDTAIDFIVALNAPPRPLLAPASEACFTLAEHLATVERRVMRVTALDPDAPHASEARSFVSTRLVPAWEAVKSRFVDNAKAAGLAIDRPLASNQECLSPSDFGFHNALVDDDGRLTFLDFEYAGSDDPAKLVSDFFCQPEVPVPLIHHAHFIERITDGLGLDQAAATRCALLLDAYRIKWTCILLNEYLALGAARRAFADAGIRPERCAAQLAKAEAKLAEINL